MIELYLSKNNNDSSPAFGKYYPRVSYKETMNIHDMAKHMSEHNTPFSEGTIEGILRDFVKCTREQTLLGNTVKVDDLAIFKVSAIGNGCAVLYDKENDKTITASIGEIGKDDRTGPSVQSLKLLAQATGEYTREELNKDGRLGWTDKAAAQIAEAKNAANGGSAPSGGSGTGNGGSQSGNGGSEQGGNSGSQNGDQNQATSFALTITKSGSGTSTVKNDSEETINSGDSLESGANVYIAVTPAEGQIPSATLNGSNVSLTENDGEYVGTFQMPAQASTLVINSGSDGEEGDQN